MTVFKPEERKNYLEKRISYHLKAYKELSPSCVRAGMRGMLVKMMLEYNKLANKIAYHCSSWW